ncbi:MAG: hypothetical protein VB878_12460 [Pirellulaceae bacterium]
MNRVVWHLSVAALLVVWSCESLLHSPCYAQEQAIESRVISVAMFKNGLALVEREATPDASGEFRISDIPKPIHGTLWFIGAADVTARIAVRDVEVEPRYGEVDLQRDLVGRNVTVVLRDMPAPIIGIVRKYAESGEATPVVNYPTFGPTVGNATATKYLVLETSSGESYIDRSLIAHLSVKGTTKTITRRRPVLLLNVPEGENADKPVRIRYLTMGLSWSPSYLVDLVDDNRLTLRQKAIVRNELGPLVDAELKLISGFPNVRFQHVTSPFSPTTSWAEFFAQINNRAAVQSVFLRNSISQQLAMPVSRRVALPVDLGAAPGGSGVDLHYESIGRHSLGKNESLSVPVATGSADYKRIVEWIVPDTRNAYGRHISQHERNQDPEKYQVDPWDALQFRNPLTIPMTTGPATIMRDGRFNGQTVSYWVSRGEQTALRVTKSLSIRTLASENEKQGNRDLVYIGGNDFQQVGVEGRLLISNHRNEVVEIMVRRQFSGKLVKADDKPDVTLREEGVYSVNRRYELTWTLILQPGEQRELNYDYTVLVDR